MLNSKSNAHNNYKIHFIFKPMVYFLELNIVDMYIIYTIFFNKCILAGINKTAISIIRYR